MNGRNAEKMLQYYRRGRSQCRHSSSMATKESQPSGLIKQIGEGILSVFYKGAVGGVGYVLGGLLLSSEAPKVEDDKKLAESLLKLAAENEIKADEMRELRLNIQRKKRI